MPPDVGPVAQDFSPAIPVAQDFCPAMPGSRVRLWPRIATAAQTAAGGVSRHLRRPPVSAARSRRLRVGGGRGRGPIPVMTLSSSAFADGAKIPAKYTQAGEEASPALTWSGAPEGVESFVLIVHDVDTAIGPGNDDMLHWMLWIFRQR